MSRQRALIGSAVALFFAITVGAGIGVQSAATAKPDGDEHGELIYVPIYSSIFYDNAQHTLELAATLAIHNVNADQSITITRADYYNTDGKLLKRYAEQPLVLRPLETRSILIEKRDTTGGTGANFLVEWRDSTQVASPVIEAVMVNAASNLGIAFTSPGRVVQRYGNWPE
ncbi:MAG TPA: DUF3124 domain-containing protein [Pirellulales bacterium]|nr:DUF3124 domain-containing protein [Pirellulales bacterium]